MAKHKTERQIDRDNRFGRPFEWVAATAIGLTSGYITFRNLVTEKFHSFLLSQTDVLKDFQTKNGSLRDIMDNWLLRTDSVRNVAHNAKENATKIPLLDPNSNEFKEGAKQILRNLRQAKVDFADYANDYAQRILRIPTRGIAGSTTGLVKRYLISGDNTLKSIAFKSIFAVGAGVAATLMAFNQLNTRDKLNENDKATGDVNRKLDAMIEAQEAADGRVIEVRGLLADKHSGATKAQAVLAQRAESQHGIDR